MYSSIAVFRMRRHEDRQHFRRLKSIRVFRFDWMAGRPFKNFGKRQQFRSSERINAPQRLDSALPQIKCNGQLHDTMRGFLCIQTGTMDDLANLRTPRMIVPCSWLCIRRGKFAVHGSRERKTFDILAKVKSFPVNISAFLAWFYHWSCTSCNSMIV